MESPRTAYAVNGQAFLKPSKLRALFQICFGEMEAPLALLWNPIEGAYITVPERQI
jgi:hypothetical protein